MKTSGLLVCSLMTSLFAIASFAAEQSLSLKLSDLKVAGTFPLNLKAPVIVSGVDENNHSYKIQFSTKLKSRNFYEVSYEIERSGKKESISSVVVQGGKTGEIRHSVEGEPLMESLFKATITE